MSMRRLDQGMAEAAASALPEKVSKELRTRYRQLRVMTRTAGLAATYAFIASKEDDSDLGAAYRRAGEGIRKQLASLGLLSGEAMQLTAKQVLTQFGQMDTVRYARASAETAALMGWLARLADALSVPDPGDRDEEDR
jgi:CRISPR/Cas system CMR-associated protein Cmr5 small subunit